MYIELSLIHSATLRIKTNDWGGWISEYIFYTLNMQPAVSTRCGLNSEAWNSGSSLYFTWWCPVWFPLYIIILLLSFISLSPSICLEERLDKANLLEEHTSNYFVNGRFGFIEDDHVPFHERGTAIHTVCVCVCVPANDNRHFSLRMLSCIFRLWECVLWHHCYWPRCAI